MTVRPFRHGLDPGVPEELVSHAVRSPMTREAAVSLAERFRGPLRGRERNVLIGLNIRNRQRSITDSIGTKGKFVAIYSPNREFISATDSSITLPCLQRLPRLLDHSEALFLNRTVQVFSRNEVFWIQPARNNRPIPSSSPSLLCGSRPSYRTYNPGYSGRAGNALNATKPFLQIGPLRYP